MRFVAAGVVYAAAIAVVVGAGAVAVGDFTGASARQRRELDAAIDQIVEQHNERKALMAKPAPSVAGASEATGSVGREKVVQAGTKETAGGGAHAGRHATLALDQGTAEPVARAGAAKGKKREVHRARKHYLPFNFATLPKFTAYTLFGLKD